jgi:S1-C subfamily serine protease
MVEVRRAGEGQSFTAEVAHICHPCDLALLTVPDSRFFEGSEALEIGDLPALQQAIEIHGFPVGGSGLAITSGIVSRIAVDYYVHSLTRLLLVQVDAAVNSGNSGGPALSDGKLVGVAMQTLDDAENVGYIVPAPIIRHFLDDVEDGRVDGFPELGFWVQLLRSAALRARLGLERIEGGVLVTAVSTSGCAHGILEPGDVVLAFDGIPIDFGGSVALGDGIRVDATFLEQRAQVGEELEVTFLREGVEQKHKIGMKLPNPLIPVGDYDRGPSYRIYAGLVFQPLTLRYLETFDDPPSRLMFYYYNPTAGGHRLLVPDRGIPGRRQVIVLSRVLTTEFTRGYQDMEDEVVLAVDGTTVRDLRHLSELLEAASGKFVTIATESGELIALDREAVTAASGEILARYQIASDRSADLQVPASLGR